MKKKSFYNIIIFLVVFLFNFSYCTKATIFDNNDDIKETVKQIFIIRNQAILKQDMEAIDALYDKRNKLAVWAYEQEDKKVKYLHNWSEKQGVIFTNIVPTIAFRKIRGDSSTYSFNLICSTEYNYVYENSPDITNSFRIGTYHSLQLKNINGNWLISKEWYTDPFADSLNLENIKVDSIKDYIINQPRRDFSNLSKRRIDTINYAFKYSGAANEEKNGFKYNSKYGDFNPKGGDCANFASQMLFEGGKFKKNVAWNFERGTGSKAWLNAQGFKEYMVGSGRASVIAHGNYEGVYKASYKLRPGDFVAYEKAGKITHISVITDADSKGYSLVNCHNSDRNRVPWDLGWSNKYIKYWLVSVHF